MYYVLCTPTVLCPLDAASCITGGCAIQHLPLSDCSRHARRSDRTWARSPDRSPASVGTMSVGSPAQHTVWLCSTWIGTREVLDPPRTHQRRPPLTYLAAAHAQDSIADAIQTKLAA
jgi:hypothetical protein